MNLRDTKMRGPRPSVGRVNRDYDSDLERSDTVAREPSMRAKTIIILIYTDMEKVHRSPLMYIHNIRCIYIIHGQLVPNSFGGPRHALSCNDYFLGLSPAEAMDERKNSCATGTIYWVVVVYRYDRRSHEKLVVC